MMKKKNGFTLIELLVVIALMLSILGIAIVSLTGISDKKKKEAWKEVVNQIETAATEYFTANEYLFEGLENGSTGTISVGRLVNEDYLNVVTNPVTEKKVSKCAIVNVTKNGDKYTSSFDERTIDSTNSSCDSQSLLITSNVGKSDYKDPNNNNDDGKYTSLLIGTCYHKSDEGDYAGDIMDAGDANGYCYSKRFQLNVDIINKKGALTSVKYCNSGDGTICKTDNYDGDITKKYEEQFPGFNETTDKAITVVDLRNQSGALTRIITDEYKIDHEKPTVSISLKTSDRYERYNTADPTINIEGNDFDRSGISSYELEGYEELPAEKSVTLPNSPIYNDFGELIEDFSGETTNPVVTIYDKVGNSSSDNTSYTVYEECGPNAKIAQKHCYGPDTRSCNCKSYCKKRNKKGKCKSWGETCSRCKVEHPYTQDVYSGKNCTGKTTCSPQDPVRTKPVTAKAYKFGELDKYCSNTGTFKFNHAGEKVAGAKINKSPTGPYRRYKFKELECSCTLTTTNGSKAITVNKVTNITESTHPDGYSYIFYKSAADCENNDKKDVKQVCTQQITGNLNYHGVKWNQGDSNHFSGKGWYFNSYQKKISLDEITSEKQACMKACKSKAGIK